MNLTIEGPLLAQIFQAATSVAVSLVVLVGLCRLPAVARRADEES